MFLTGLVMGVIVGFLVALIVFIHAHRTNLRNMTQLPVMVQEYESMKLELEKSQRAFQQMMRDVNHKFLRPPVATLKGILVLIKREHHQGYADLALDELDKIENNFTNFFKKYEKFQDNEPIPRTRQQHGN